MRKKVSIGFRLNPNVDAKTHKNISTGKADNKFGLSIKNFKSFLKEINKFKNIKLEALSVLIGSQILNDRPFKKTLNVMNKLIKELKFNLKYIDLGGGFGINYSDNEKPIDLNYLVAIAIISSFIFSFLTVKFFLIYIKKFSMNAFVIYRIIIALILFVLIY